MLLSHCPRCQESVRVPDVAAESTSVRCPWCRAEFPIIDVLEQLPPALIVVGAPEPVPAAEPPSEPEFGGFSLQPEEPPALGISLESGDAEPAPAGPAISASHAPRKQKNPVWELAKIAAGAMLAIPIAQLILWWLPGSWQRDPLNIGPAVGAYVPWIVPANFRGQQEALDQDDDQRVASAGPERRPPPPVKRRINERDKQNARTQDANNRDAGNRDAGNRDAGKKNNNTGGSTDQRPRSITFPGTALPENRGQPGSTAADNPGSGAPPGTEPPPAPAADGIGVRNAPVYHVADLVEAIDDVESTSVTLEAADEGLTDQAREQLQRQWYATLSHLGEVVTYIDRSEEGIAASVDRVVSALQQISEHPKQLAWIGNSSGERIQQNDLSGQGILIFGTVKKISPHGRLFETVIELAAREKAQVTVVSRADPHQVYKVKSRVLMLGSIVDDPTINLAGYFGSDASVVMGGFPHLVAE